MAKAVSKTKKKAVKKVSRPAAAKKTVAAVKKKGSSVKKPAVKKVEPKRSGEVSRYRCKLCGYVYTPLRGEPHNGIPAGTAFEDLPDDYVCPVCGQQGKGKVGKWGFEPWRPTKWICPMCDYVYDEKRGEPHRGIKPRTRFEDLPDDYICPVCALDARIKNRYGKVVKEAFKPLMV